MTDDAKRTGQPDTLDNTMPVKEEPAAATGGDSGNVAREITIDLPEPDPETYPNSPQFDPEKWQAFSTAMTDRLAEAVQTAHDALTTAVHPATFNEFLSVRAAAIQQVAAAATAITSNTAITANYWQNFTQGYLAGLQKTIQELTAIAPSILEYVSEMGELLPYLEEELKKPEYGGEDIDDLYIAARAKGDETAADLFKQAMAAARAARDAANGKPKTATIRRADKIDFPLDKINSKAWNLLEKDTRGQIKFDMSKRGSKEELPVYYAINFEELDGIQITKRLTPFDKRVYVAVSALFNAGNNVITLAQIYKHMGYKGKAGGTDLEKINNSILKMLGAQIYLSNELEAQKYKGYSKFIYRGALLPLETGELYNVQGALTDAAIHIFREPPLISFARLRKQITTVDLKLLQSPVSKTDANLLIDDYLIERISRAKNGKTKHCRILFKTLYDHAEIKTPKQQQRAPEKVVKYLDYYQQQKFITRYTMESDGITVYWQ